MLPRINVFGPEQIVSDMYVEELEAFDHNLAPVVCSSI